MRVQLVQEAKAIADASHLELGAEGQSHQCQVRLGETYRELVIAGALAAFHAHLGARVGIDLAEEGQLDLTRKEEVLQARETAALVLLDIALGQIPDEIARHAHVEEELPRAAPLVERERLARSDEIHGRGRTAPGRRRGRQLRRHGRGGDGCGRRLLALGLEALEAVGHGLHGFAVLILHGLELLAHLLHVPADRLCILRVDGEGRCEQARHEGDGNE
ncbi:MAG: hypothetical protein DME10_01420 [Candidatus Rokuibacteriota bacterium]|nr:MAG: hypothetical protein DME10_01420 [Candidatus Rokubacteria bacterium]